MTRSSRSVPLHESEAVRQAVLGSHALRPGSDAGTLERRGTSAPEYRVTPGVAGTADGPPRAPAGRPHRPRPCSSRLRLR